MLFDFLLIAANEFFDWLQKGLLTTSLTGKEWTLATAEHSARPDE